MGCKKGGGKKPKGKQDKKKEPPQTNVMAFYYADSDDIPCKET